MPILDKLRGVGEAVRDKVKETFGEGEGATDEGAEPGGIEEEGEGRALEPALDVDGALKLLGLGVLHPDDATLADVREAYRALARRHHPIARRDGMDSEAARTLDRLLEALELLEEHLVPLAGAGPGGGGAPSGSGGRAEPPPRRKRATARKR